MTKLKVLLTVLVAIGTFISGFYFADILIDKIVLVFPASIEEWYGVIKLGLWFFSFTVVLAITIIVTSIVTTLTAYLFDLN